MAMELEGQHEVIGANPVYWFGIDRLKGTRDYVAFAVGQPPHSDKVFLLSWDDRELASPGRLRVVTGAKRFVEDPENGYGGLWTRQQFDTYRHK